MRICTAKSSTVRTRGLYAKASLRLTAFVPDAAIVGTVSLMSEPSAGYAKQLSCPLEVSGQLDECTRPGDNGSAFTSSTVFLC